MMRRELTAINPKRDAIALKDDKVTPIIEFLNDNYKILVNRLDSNQILVQSVNKEYPYTPTLDDISLHLMEEGIQHSDTLLRKIVRSPNQMKSFDPISDYFTAIKGTYQGKSHIDLLCNFLEPTDFGNKPDAYYTNRMNKLMRKWFVAAAAQSLKLRPNDVALGFIQEKEGIGKTWLSKFLVPDDLKDYITISEKDSKKFDLRSSFTNSFVVLFDECVGLNNRTAEDFKATLSADKCKIIDKRFAFPVTVDRVANAMFTTNNKTGNHHKGFLTPALGYRRFGCIALDTIDFEYSNKVDVNQIWAEALMLIDQNFDYAWSQNDFVEFNEYNQRFKIETSASLLIKQNYEIPETETEGQWLMPTEIIKNLRAERKINADISREVTPENIGETLNQLGFFRKSKKINGTPRYRYLVKQI